MTTILSEALRPSDRVLVLGASGWFGRTFLDLALPALPTLAIASQKRGRFQTWDFSLIARFRPSIVLNFAALTKDRLMEISEDEFQQTNLMLIARMEQAASLPSVRLLLAASSGAALSDPTSLYGQIKAHEESVALALNGPTRAVTILRVYSVSGPYASRPERYAFTSFITQAASGAITVRATHPVYRRYSSVRDLLLVGLVRAASGWSGVIESGGELLEMGDLAAQIAALVNPSAVVSRPIFQSSPISIYASDNSSWKQSCEEVGLVPDSLERQIRRTAQDLIQRGVATEQV